VTPEGKVKRTIKLLLDRLFPEDYPCYTETLVTQGYGRAGLDFTCCLFGWFVAIEAKAPGEWLTPRQRLTAIEILAAGGKVFIISNDEGLWALERWIVKNYPVGKP
jgi:hypothetical protein